MEIKCDDCKFNASCKTKISYGNVVTCGKFESKSSENNQKTPSLPSTKKTTFSMKNGNKQYKNYFNIFNKNKSRSVINAEKKARIAEIKVLGEKLLQDAKETYGIDNHQKNDENWEKRKILKDIEIGRGGPDIAGLKKMCGEHDSKIIADAKKKLLR